MRKLERNVSAAHEQDARWKAIELEKLFARHQVLRAGNSKCRRPGTGSHDDVPAFENVVSDRDRCRTRECRTAVKRIDASLEKARLSAPRDIRDQRTFELHEPRPVDLRVRGLDALAA